MSYYAIRLKKAVSTLTQHGMNLLAYGNAGVSTTEESDCNRIKHFSPLRIQTVRGCKQLEGANSKSKLTTMISELLKIYFVVF
jgi:hypothetical protein